MPQLDAAKIAHIADSVEQLKGRMDSYASRKTDSFTSKPAGGKYDWTVTVAIEKDGKKDTKTISIPDAEDANEAKVKARKIAEKDGWSFVKFMGTDSKRSDAEGKIRLIEKYRGKPVLEVTEEEFKKIKREGIKHNGVHYGFKDFFVDRGDKKSDDTDAMGVEMTGM